jgi:hypothetical protein
MNFIRTVASNPLENKGTTQLEWTVIIYKIDEDISYKLKEYLQNLIDQKLSNVHIRVDSRNPDYHLFFAFPFISDENKKTTINEIEKILNDFAIEIREARRLKNLLDNIKS